MAAMASNAIMRVHLRLHRDAEVEARGIAVHAYEDGRERIIDRNYEENPPEEGCSRRFESSAIDRS